MIDLSGLTRLRDAPYFIAAAADVLPDFKALADAWPAESQFKAMGGPYTKRSLSERNHPETYHAFIASSPAWRDLYAYVKSPAFIEDIMVRLRALMGNWGFLGRPPAHCSARFELSALPADFGVLLPHTDIPSKLVTMVVGMDLPGTWERAWGGGTDILRPCDPDARLRDYEAPLEVFERIHTFEHEPNAAVVFVKTDNSWHSVGPVRGPAGRFRRTITINIERLP